MANALTVKSGWGMVAALTPVTQVVAGANAVLGNVGVALSIVAGNAPIRLTKLSWRVDLAPDVAAGLSSSPVLWRVFVAAPGTLPQDVTTFQTQAYPAGAHPEIPSKTSAGTPLPLLWDEWLDFSKGDPGLSRLYSRDFPDAGPRVNALETLNCVIVPIIDANLDQANTGAVNAQIVLAASGLNDQTQITGSVSDNGSRSLPRYDVSLNR